MKETSQIVHDMKDRIVAHLRWYRNHAMRNADYGAVRAFELAESFVLAEPLLNRYTDTHDAATHDHEIPQGK